MMRLFSVNAVDNQGDVAAIAEDYGRLFRGTQRRELRLDRLAWTTGENRIIGSGPFEAIIRRHGDVFTRHVDGWITIEAGLVDGDWRIQRIIHRDTP